MGTIIPTAGIYEYAWPMVMPVNYHAHSVVDNHDDYSGGEVDGYTITDDGSYTEAGKTGVTETSTSFSRSWSYDGSGDDGYVFTPINASSQSGGSYSGQATADYSQGQDWVEAYDPSGTVARSSTSDEVRNSSQTYHTEGSGTYSDAMLSTTSNSENDNSSTAHDEWHYTSASDSDGWSYTDSDAHSGDTSSSYSSAWSDGTNSSSLSGVYSSSLTPSSSTYTYSQGTPPTGTPQAATYTGPTASAYAALTDALIADAADSYTATSTSRVPPKWTPQSPRSTPWTTVPRSKTSARRPPAAAAPAPATQFSAYSVKRTTAPAEQSSRASPARAEEAAFPTKRRFPMLKPARMFINPTLTIGLRLHHRPPRPRFPPSVGELTSERVESASRCGLHFGGLASRTPLGSSQSYSARTTRWRTSVRRCSNRAVRRNRCGTSEQTKQPWRSRPALYAGTTGPKRAGPPRDLKSDFKEIQQHPNLAGRCPAQPAVSYRGDR